MRNVLNFLVCVHHSYWNSRDASKSFLVFQMCDFRTKWVDGVVKLRHKNWSVIKVKPNSSRSIPPNPMSLSRLDRTESAFVKPANWMPNCPKGLNVQPKLCGIVWVQLSMFSNFYQLDLHNRMMCCMCNFMMKTST
jgi:hypothetical protein